MKKAILRFLKFIGLSGIGWLLDFAVFSLLCAVSPYTGLNNMVSSLLGATFVFVFATKKIFTQNGKLPLWVKYGIYAVYQVLLISGISWLLTMIQGALMGITGVGTIAVLIRKFSKILAKILVTPVTMVLNYFVMRTVVEKIK